MCTMVGRSCAEPEDQEGVAPAKTVAGFGDSRDARDATADEFAVADPSDPREMYWSPFALFSRPRTEELLAAYRFTLTLTSTGLAESMSMEAQAAAGEDAALQQQVVESKVAEE